MKQTVYLDYAATAPMDIRVYHAMQPYFFTQFGNPSSLHSLGREAKNVLQKSKQMIANCISAKPDEIVFTSGGTEGNNLAILGICEAMQAFGKHIITTQMEHHSVLKTCEALENKGYEVTYLKPNEEGCISIEQVKKALRPDTILVSIMYGNNETGSMQPIAEIAELLLEHPAYFHTDAVQAFGTENINVSDLKVDMFTVSGHKINGPKGIGFLYVREKTKVLPLLFGGSQQRKLRPGTENIPSIVGLAYACMYQKDEIDKKRAHLEKVRTAFFNGLHDRQIQYSINGSKESYLPHIVNISFPTVSISSFLANLDLEGICVSGGSACTAGSIQGSHVLAAMYGKEDARLFSSIRVSFGGGTTVDDVKKAVEAIDKILQRSLVRKDK